MQTLFGRTFIRNPNGLCLLFCCSMTPTWLSPTASWAQGTVVFSNRGVSNSVVVVSAPVYGPELVDSTIAKIGNSASGIPVGTQVYSGALLSGSNFRAQLFAAPGAMQPESAMVAVTNISAFRTGTAAGLLPVLTVTLGNVPADAPAATLQMRVWDDSSGLYPTWAEARQAWCAGLIPCAKSFPIEVAQIGGVINPTPLMENLRSFNLYYSWAPQILVQPQSLALSAGATASFRVFVACQCAVGYQWLHNAVEVPGATNEVLTIAGIQTADFGDYVVRLSDGTYSATATLSELAAPFIITPPKPQTVIAGTPAAMSVTAGGLQPLSYQWRMEGTNLPGATTNTLSFPAVQLANAGVYQVVVTNTLGAITSAPARLQIVAALLNVYTATELEFRTRPGFSYVIQASPDLVTWTNMEGPIAVDGSLWSKLYSTRSAARLYYRVELAP